MPQELKLTLFEKGDFQDPHGNYWCNATFELPDGTIEDHVKWVVKDPMSVKVGESYYGRLEEQVSKSNKPYLRFRREQRPDNEQPTPAQLSAVAKNTWQPRDDSHIRAQWAIGQAMVVFDKEVTNYRQVEEIATHLFKMVDRVKESNGLTVQEPTSPNPSPSRGLQELSGYERAKQAHQTLKAKQPQQEAKDPEFESMLAKGFEADGINIDDIPF